MMNGLIVGLLNTFFWFVPWYSWTQDFMGESMYMTQNGTHVGGMAYLLIASSILYSIFSYRKNFQLQIVFGSIQLFLAALFMLNGNLSWGLPAIFIVSVLGIWFGIQEKKKSTSTIVSSNKNDEY